MERCYLPEEIEGDRVVLRRHRPALAELMFSYIEKDRERLARFLTWVEFTQTLEDEQSYISLASVKWESFEVFDYGIFDKISGFYMGNIGVHQISWENECCEFGYWILGQFEGKGFVVDSVAALERACFLAGFHRLEIRCSSNNLRSARVPERRGFSLEGRLVQNRVESGEHYDTLIYGKLNPNQGA